MVSGSNSEEPNEPLTINRSGCKIQACLDEGLKNCLWAKYLIHNVDFPVVEAIKKLYK